MQAFYINGGMAIQINEPNGNTINVTTVLLGDEGWDAAVALVAASTPVLQPDPLPPALTEAERLAQARLRAPPLSKLQFCLGVVQFGLLTDADAIAAARGEWPSAMDGLLPLLTEAQKTEILIEWGAAREVERMNVNVLTLASWRQIPDETMDALFNIQVS